MDRPTKKSKDDDRNETADRARALDEELQELKVLVQSGRNFPRTVALVKAELLRLHLASLFLDNANAAADGDGGPLCDVLDFMDFRELHLLRRVSKQWRRICGRVLSERLVPIQDQDDECYLFHHRELPRTFAHHRYDGEMVPREWIRNHGSRRRGFVVTITFRTERANDTRHMCLFYTHAEALAEGAPSAYGGPHIELNGWDFRGQIRFHLDDWSVGGEEGYARRLDFRSPPVSQGGVAYNNGEEHTLRAIMEHPNAYLEVDGRVVARERARRFRGPVQVGEMMRHHDVQVGSAKDHDRNFVGELSLVNMRVY